MADEPFCSYIPHTICPTCQKCVSGCPAQIDILAVLQIYAEHQEDQTELVSRLQRLDALGQPLDCIECGACNTHCPQHLDVRSIMRRLAMMQI